MSKLTEYLSLINKGMENPSQVAEGWLNVVKKELGALPEDQLEEIARRRAICNECPYMSLNLFEDDTEYQKLFNKKFKSSRKGEKFCGICSCPIKGKTTSLTSNCGLETYNKEYPKNLQELKWTKYESNKD